jgi:hypothetical protein
VQEQKKKELEDLDAVLAELGLDAKAEAEAAEAEAAGGASSKAAKRKAKKAQQGGAANGSGAATHGNGAASADSGAEIKVCRPGELECGVCPQPSTFRAQLQF